MTTKDHAPSAARRKRLKDREATEGKNFQRVLSTYPIEKYYGMSERLLGAFNQALDDRRLDDAYVFGLRLATFSIETLPQHAQYHSPALKRLKAKNARQVDQVLQKMESVASRMDAEELRLARQRKQVSEARKRAEEARRRQEEQRLQQDAKKQQHHQQILQQQREELRRQQEAAKLQQKKQAQQELEQRARDKLKLLNDPNPPAKAQPPQEKRDDAANTTLLSANTGQALHTKAAVAQQKAAEEAARLKAKQREIRTSQSIPPKEPKRNSLFSKKQPKKNTAKKPTKKESPPKQPSKLDPNALAQVDQLKQEVAKLDTANKAVDYKSEFAKFQAEWSGKKSSSQSKLQHHPKNNSSRQVAAAEKRPTATKQTSAGKVQSAKPSQEEMMHKLRMLKNTHPGSQQNLTAPTTGTEKNSVPQQVQQPPAIVVSHKEPQKPAKSKLSIFPSLSPKKKKSSNTKQVVPESQSANEGFELKMDDAGPTVVDDFSYQDAAYRTKLTPHEAKTIGMLEEAIQLQEKRLHVLENSNERALLRAQAKKRLHGGDRKGALHCLAKKKRIHQTIEVVKQAIFNMETQIIWLESAVENREVNKIMKEATDAMASYGNGVRVADFTDERLGEVLASVGQGEMDYDEEELLSELHEGEPQAHQDDDDGLLSLPTVPDTEVQIPDDLPKNESAAVSKILASLF